MFDFLSKSFSSLFSSLTGSGKLSEKNIADSYEKIQDALLESDVPYNIVTQFMKEVQEDVVGKKVMASMKPAEQFVKVVYDRMLTFLGGEYLQESFTFQIPATIMMMGLQGSGKTTTIAKLATFIQKQAQKRGKTRSILCASVDFYRPAAIEQLEILADQVKIDFYKPETTDPIQAAKAIMEYRKKHGYEILLLDTAGRLHVDQAMMQELKEVKRLAKPKYSFLVLDSMTGQESLTVAKQFSEAIGFDYAVMSKIDSDARGGSAFSFRYALKKPILFMGTGEKPEDLELFRPERIVKRMLGMGDIETLLESAQEKIEEQDQRDIQNIMSSGDMTLDDFAKQMGMVNKMGSLAGLMKYMPNMGGMHAKLFSPEMLEKAEREMKRFKAIISSMTAKERVFPKMLNKSRKQRIAKGAGVQVTDVNQLLEKFEQSKQSVKLLKKSRWFR